MAVAVMAVAVMAVAVNPNQLSTDVDESVQHP